MKIPATLIQKTPVTPIKIPKKKKYSKVTTVISVIIGIIALIATFLFFFLYLPGKSLLTEINAAKNIVQTLKQSVSDKDLTQGKNSLNDLNQQLTVIDNKKALHF